MAAAQQYPFDDQCADETSKIVFRDKAWKKKPCLVVEWYEGHCWVQIPLLLLTVKVKDLPEIVDSEDAHGLYQSKEQFRMKGQVVDRILKLQEKGLIDITTDLVIRSLRDTKLTADLDGDDMRQCVDKDAGKQGCDLITFSGLLQLFRDRVQSCIKRYAQDRAPLAEAYALVMVDLLYGTGGLEADNLETFDGCRLCEDYDEAECRAFGETCVHRRWMEDEIELGFQGEDYLKPWMLHATTGTADEEGVALETFFEKIFRGEILLQHDCDYERVVLPVKEPVRGSYATSNARSSSASAASAASPTFGPEAPDDEDGRIRRVGRKPIPFGEVLSRAAKTLNIDLSHNARLMKSYAHVLTCKFFKLLLLQYQGPIGFATDDTDSGGRSISQVTIRAPFLRPPLVKKPMVITFPLPPMLSRKVSAKDQEKAVKKTKGVTFSKDDVEQHVAAVQQDSLLAAVEDLISFKSLGGDNWLLVVSDKGSKVRKLYLFLMASGHRVVIFFDQPHVDGRMMVDVCRTMLPKEFIHIMKVTKSSQQVHGAKIANVFNDAAKNHDDDLIMTMIGDYRKEISLETKCLSMNAEQLIPAFRSQCEAARSSMNDMDNMRWMSECYCINSLKPSHHTFLIAGRTVYTKEFGLYKEQLKARVTRSTANGIKDIAYNKEDLLALEAKIKKRMKEVKNKWGKRGPWDIFEDQPEEMERGDKKDEKVEDQDAPAEESDGDAKMGGVTPKNKPQYEREDNDDKSKAQIGDRMEKEASSTSEGSGDEGGDKINIHKKRTKKFIPSLFFFLAERRHWMKCLAFERVCKPVLFGHGFGICLNAQNIEARGMSFRLPSIILSELAGWQITPLDAEMSLLEDEYPEMASFLGQGFLDVTWQQVKIALQNMIQCRRLFQYAKSERLEQSVRSVVMRYSLDQKTEKHLKWLLASPKLFQFNSESWGLALEEDIGVARVYSDSVEDSNDVRLAADTRWQKMAPRPLSFSPQGRSSVADWEVSIYKGYTYPGVGDDPISAVHISYMLESGNYELTKKLCGLLESRKFDEFNAMIGEHASVREMSTRHLEVQGGGFTRARRRANNEGFLVEHIPHYFCENSFPEFLPWMQPKEEKQPAAEEDADPDAQDAPAQPKGRMKKGQQVKGYSMTFSGLDGKQPYPEGTTEEDFWEVDTFEQFAPFINPGEVDSWMKEKFAEVNKMADGPEKTAALQNLYANAFDDCRHSLWRNNRPNHTLMRTIVKNHLTVNKENYRLKHETLKALGKKKYNVEHLWRVPISELVLEKWSSHMIAEERQFSRGWRIGTLQTKLMRGIWEKFGAIKKVPMVRFAGGHMQHAQYAIMLNSLPSMNITPLLICPRLEMGQEGDPELGEPFKAKKKRKFNFGSLAQESSGFIRAFGASGAGSPSSSSSDDDAPQDNLNWRDPKLIEDDFDEVEYMYFTLPQNVASYALPIQCGAGKTQDTQLKMYLTLSHTMAVCTGSVGEELQFVDAEWVFTGSNKYCVIRVKADRSTFLPPLEVAMQLGFGLRDQWIHGAEEKSSVGADAKDIVQRLVTENPRILHRVNSDDTPEDWNLAKDARNFQQVVQNYGKTADMSPRWYRLMKEADPNCLPTNFRFDPQEYSNRHIFEESDLRPPGYKPFDICPVMGWELDVRTGKPWNEGELPEFPIGEQRVLDLGPLPEQLLPEQPAMESMDVDPPPKKSDTLLPPEPAPAAEATPRVVAAPLSMGIFGGPVSFGIQAAEPTPALLSQASKEEREAHEEKSESKELQSFFEAPVDQKTATGLVEDLMAEAEEEDGFLFTGDRNIPAKLKISFPEADPEFKNDKVKAPDADPDPSPTDIRFMRDYVSRVRLEDRQWIEVLFTLYYGGRNAAKTHLVKRGFYTAEDADTGSSKAIEVTLTASCQEFLIELKKCVADSWKFLVGNQHDKDKAAPKKKMRKKKSAGLTNAMIEGSFMDFIKEGESAGKPMAGARNADIIYNKALEDPNEVEFIGNCIMGVTEDERKKRENERKERVDKAAAKLKEQYEGNPDAKEKKAVTLGLNAFPMSVDLYKLQAEEDENERALHCSQCKIKIGSYSYKYLCPEGPRMELVTESGKRITRACGQRCHLYRASSANAPRCMCGYWKNGFLYADAEGVIELEPEQHWKCCARYMELKARQQTQCCECPMPIKFENIKTIPEKFTFGGNARKQPAKNAAQ